MTLCKRPHRLEAYATMLLGLADPDRASFKTLGGRAKLRLSRGRRANAGSDGASPYPRVILAG